MRHLSIVACALVLACSSDDTVDAPPPGDAGGGGAAPGQACPPGALEQPDGSCLAAGIAPDGCATGFEHDGDVGCTPVLPARDCGAGELAIPGDRRCKPLADCGEAPWGHLVGDADTEWVDPSYTGGDSDGTQAKPWLTIQEGIDAALTGALVAVAAGSYVEDLVIDGKPIELAGRCPELVEVVGGSLQAAVLVSSAPGVVLRGLALRGDHRGIEISDSLDALLESLWIHDTPRSSLFVHDMLGPASAVLRGSLLEQSHVSGLAVFGGSVTLEDSAVRDIQPRDSDQFFGYGLLAQTGETTAARSQLTVRRSLVEGCHEMAVRVLGSSADLDGVVVRDTSPSPADLAFGRALSAWSENGEPPVVSVSRSSFERQHEVGISVAGGEASIDAVVVRDTREQLQQQLPGFGISLHPDDATGAGTQGTVRASLVERTTGPGVLVSGSAVSIEGVVIREGLPAPGGVSGRGVNAQSSALDGSPSLLDLAGSVIDGTLEVGVLVLGSSASLWATAIRATRSNGLGEFGDGVAVISTPNSADATLAHLFIAESERAGVSSFGAMLELSGVTLECNDIDLDGEMFGALTPEIADLEGNVCGCGGMERTCKMLSSGLAPPPPLEDPSN